MTTSTIIILLLFASGAAFIQRTTGFGFGIFIMTMLPYLMPSYGEATTLSGLLAAVTSLTIVMRYRKHLEWSKLLPILTVFLVVSSFAVHLLSLLASATLHTVLGIMLIAAALYFWFFAGRLTVKPNIATQMSLGTLSGFMGGLFGMQGPPAVLYFLQVSKTKEGYAVLAQAYFLIGNIVMTIYRAHEGFLTPMVLSSWCIALPGVALGTVVGGLVFSRLSMTLLRKIVYIYIGISGVLALL